MAIRVVHIPTCKSAESVLNPSSWQRERAGQEQIDRLIALSKEKLAKIYDDPGIIECYAQAGTKAVLLAVASLAVRASYTHKPLELNGGDLTQECIDTGQASAGAGESNATSGECVLPQDRVGEVVGAIANILTEDSPGMQEYFTIGYGADGSVWFCKAA